MLYRDLNEFVTPSWIEEYRAMADRFGPEIRLQHDRYSLCLYLIDRAVVQSYGTA